MSGAFILLTGCSGGGKSTLLAALGERGFATVPEPGRRIVAEELAAAGRALPWVDMAAFARRAIEVAAADLAAAAGTAGPVVFDRGLIDAAVALEASGGPPVAETLGEARPYGREVLLAPPWKDLFSRDSERRHGFAEAVAEFERLDAVLDQLGYRKITLPRVSVRERVRFVQTYFG